MQQYMDKLQLKDMSTQLEIKNCSSGEYSNIYPILDWEGYVKEGSYGSQTIKDIMLWYNHVWLEFDTNRTTTRKTVPSWWRRRGRFITYESCKGNLFTEYYVGTEFDDSSWGNGENWVELPTYESIYRTLKEYFKWYYPDMYPSDFTARFHCYDTLEEFNEHKSDLDRESICFVKETNQIYCQETWFGADISALEEKISAIEEYIYNAEGNTELNNVENIITFLTGYDTETTLQQVLSAIGTRIDYLVEGVENNATAITNLKNNLNELGAEMIEGIRSLTGSLSKLEDRVLVLEETIPTIQEDLAALKKQVNSNTANISSLDTKVVNLQSWVELFSVEQVLKTGTLIATITTKDGSYNIYAPEGGSVGEISESEVEEYWNE